jgi:tetratricopeptide (TPR) repeat protein
MLALVFALELPNEIVAWRFAAALEAREAGDKEEADRLLAEVLARRPDEERYQLEQFQWFMDDGKYEDALAFLQKRFALKPTDTKERVKLLLQRSNVYLHLRRYADAVADCRELKRINETTGTPSRAEVLNGLAYARALGDLELDEALVDIDVAILESRAEVRETEQVALQLKRANKNNQKVRSLLAWQQRSLGGCLDTRGFVRMKLGQVARARKDFDEAIQLTQQADAFFRKNPQELTISLEEFDKRAKQQHAVLLYHRSLNYELQGLTEEAKQDFAKARELIGKDPDDTLF